MPRASLIAATALVLICGVILAWLLLRPDAQAPGKSGNDTAAVPTTSPGGTQAQGPAGDRPTDSQPREPATGPKAADQPGVGEWLVRGRIEFAPELAKLVPVQDEWNRDAQIYYLAEGRDQAEAISLFAGLDEDLAFSETFSQSDFGLGEGAALPLGKWQLLYGHDASTAPSLYDVGLAAIKGIVTPRITGRVIDFGVVTIGEDEFFYRYVLLAGRLVHSSGRALAESSQYTLAARDGEEAELGCSFRTIADGSFFAVCPVRQPHDIARLKTCAWRIGARAQDWGEEVPEGTSVRQPVWDGRRAEFGDITLAGALVEIVLHGIEVAPLLDASGDLKCDAMNGGYLGESVAVTFNAEQPVYVRAFSPPHINLSLLPEGRYLWDARATANGFFPELDGVLLAREGEVHLIELDFTPLASIPLLITKGGDGPASVPDRVWITWQVRSADQLIADDSYYYEEGARVPVRQGCETEVLIRCEGWKDARAIARPGMESLEVTLEPGTDPMQAEPPTATMIVVGAAGPAGADIGKLGAVLHVKLPNWETSYKGLGWVEGVLEHQITLWNFGQGTVTLSGGYAWGYPGGILSGPIQFAIEAGQTLRLELPPIAEPPWATPITKMNVRVTTSGSPLKILRVPVRIEGQALPIAESFYDGGTMPVRGYPLALTDGREDYPLTFTQGDKGIANLTIDLPHTLEVRLTRGGKPIDQFTVWAATDGVKKPDLYVQCEAESVHGVAKLWLPRGTADVHVWYGSIDVVRQIELIPGQVVLVEAESPGLELTLEIPETGYDRYANDFEAPELWTLQTCDAAGNWSDHEGVSRSTGYMLLPGSYRMVPWNGSEPVKIELDEDKTVRLPAIGVPKFGSVILKFDFAALNDADASAHFGYMITGLIKPGQQPDGWSGLISTQVPDGFKLSGLPLNADLAIWGDVDVRDDSGSYALLLRPLAVRATSDGQQLEAVIRRAITLDREWQYLHARWITPVENLQLEVGETALPGRQEIVIRDDAGAIILHEWVIVPEGSDEPFKIPDALRTELESRGLIEPIDGE